MRTGKKLAGVLVAVAVASGVIYAALSPGGMGKERVDASRPVSATAAVPAGWRLTFDPGFTGSQLNTSVWAPCFVWAKPSAGCTNFVRTEYDHIFSTTQTIYHGDWTGSVAAPNGTYQVYWSSSTESGFQQVPNCADGPGVATDNGFVAALVTP